MMERGRDAHFVVAEEFTASGSQKAFLKGAIMLNEANFPIYDVYLTIWKQTASCQTN